MFQTFVFTTVSHRDDEFLCNSQETGLYIAKIIPSLSNYHNTEEFPFEESISPRASLKYQQRISQISFHRVAKNYSKDSLVRS